MRSDLTPLLLVAAAAAVYYFVIRPAKDGVKAVARAGETINDAIIPGPDSLGTWIYGLFNKDPDPTAPVVVRPRPPVAAPPRPAPYDYGFGPGSGPLRR